MNLPIVAAVIDYMRAPYSSGSFAPVRVEIRCSKRRKCVKKSTSGHKQRRCANLAFARKLMWRGTPSNLALFPQRHAINNSTIVSSNSPLRSPLVSTTSWDRCRLLHVHTSGLPFGSGFSCLPSCWSFFRARLVNIFIMIRVCIGRNPCPLCIVLRSRGPKKPAKWKYR